MAHPLSCWLALTALAVLGPTLASVPGGQAIRDPSVRHVVETFAQLLAGQAAAASAQARLEGVVDSRLDSMAEALRDVDRRTAITSDRLGSNTATLAEARITRFLGKRSPT